MNRERWQAFEDLLDEFSIKPIVAVIPNNEDPRMVFDSHDEDFWPRVRNWQHKGWTIGLHGYAHLMRPTMVRQMLPYYDRSEFSGLSYDEQAEKIRRGFAILQGHDIAAEVFIAPGHCFDKLTMRALKDETPIRTISDGIAINPFYSQGMFWLPVQLSEYGRKPFGVWTICMHPNTSTTATLDALRNAIAAHRSAFVSLGDIATTKRSRSVLDWAYGLRFWYRRGRLGKLILNLPDRAALPKAN